MYYEGFLLGALSIFVSIFAENLQFSCTENRCASEVTSSLIQQNIFLPHALSYVQAKRMLCFVLFLSHG